MMLLVSISVLKEAPRPDTQVSILFLFSSFFLCYNSDDPVDVAVRDLVKSLNEYIKKKCWRSFTAKIDVLTMTKKYLGYSIGIDQRTGIHGYNYAEVPKSDKHTHELLNDTADGKLLQIVIKAPCYIVQDLEKLAIRAAVKNMMYSADWFITNRTTTGIYVIIDIFCICTNW